ncbi:uncharacterized protein LOC128128126 [Lactuca sativa]|uniref:uncharacterized protein LOC128128126 n=1 Tax=Lactuca sativa TaxID=4236 RepID=UPI0022AF2AD7|nr:uncharacterized protein LOC128128126 [Lactuca sativa]
MTFMNELRLEWMAVVSTVKAHEQFKSYSLAKVVGILKSHESEVTKEEKVVSDMGSLALISKGKCFAEEEEESDVSEYDLTSEEYAMMVTNPKKFARRKFPINKNQDWQGSYSSEKAKDEAKIISQKNEDKKESKLAGDSGYDCNYCHDMNQFAKDYMLRKLAEKRDGEDDEAYYMRKLEEIKNKKTTNSAKDEFGGVEVWSTDSEDEEVRKPTHGRAYVAKEAGSAGKCLMVSAGSSTESADEESNLTEAKCFAAKPVSEQINDCDRLIKKSYSIHSFDQSNAKLASENKIDLDNVSEFDEMSEISVEDVVDCSEFTKSETENKKPLILENSVEFARLAKNKEKKLKEKDVVYQKVQIVTNQVYAAKGVTPRQTVELIVLVEKDNAEGCKDFFWPAPIDNADETVGLSK